MGSQPGDCRWPQKVPQGFVWVCMGAILMLSSPRVHLSQITRNGNLPNLERKMTIEPSLHKKSIIHHVTTMLATSKNAIFPGHNQQLIISTDDPSL